MQNLIIDEESAANTQTCREFFARLNQLLPQFQNPAAAFHITSKMALMTRGIVLGEALLAANGGCVMAGPFAGMQLVTRQHHPGARLYPPTITGSYEYPLWPYWQAAIAQPYDVFLNIGAADGYYAVGMARACPTTTVIAAEADATLQQNCASTAALNNVQHRISIIGAVTAESLAATLLPYAGKRVLLLCDIEGAELEVLAGPALPALSQVDMIVELHEVFQPGLIATLQQRFASTHDFTLVSPDAYPPPPAWAEQLSDLDKMLLHYEGRQGYTPFGVFKARIES